MNTMNVPGFTAEASIYKTGERYEMIRDIGHVADGRAVLPQLRRTFTGSGNNKGVAMMLCDAFGGGLSSNSDGSVTCTFY